MKYTEIFEKRRNPDVNKKETLYDLFAKYKGVDNVFFHVSSIDKIGVNPQYANENNTPLGVYAFKGSILIKDLENKLGIMFDEENSNSKRPSDKQILSKFQYTPVNPKHIFVVECDGIEENVLNLTNVPAYAKQLSTIVGKELYNKALDTLKEYKGTLIGNFDKLYKLTQILSYDEDMMEDFLLELDENPPDTKKWRKLLVDLGFDYIDDSGYGIIHHMEPFQTVFLNPIFKVIDKYSLTFTHTMSKRRSIKVDSIDTLLRNKQQYRDLKQFDHITVTGIEYEMLLDYRAKTTFNDPYFDFNKIVLSSVEILYDTPNHFNLFRGCIHHLQLNLSMSIYENESEQRKLYNFLTELFENKTTVEVKNVYMDNRFEELIDLLEPDWKEKINFIKIK